MMSVVSRGRGQLPRGRSRRAFHLGGVEQLDRRARHDSADGVLVDELGMPVPTQQNGKIIKPGNDPLEFDTVHKKNRYRSFALPHMVQENVLNVLRLFVGHGYYPSFLSY